MGAATMYVSSHMNGHVYFWIKRFDAKFLCFDTKFLVEFSLSTKP